MTKEPFTTIHCIIGYVDPVSPKMAAQIQAAMRRYAEEKARHFAGWICDQVIAGRTYDKLWRDYIEQHPLE